MIIMDGFTPRNYQLDFYDAMENSGGKFRNAIIVHPRKCGKDMGIGFQYAVRTAVRKTTTILYMLKSYAQAKQVIWDMITNDGVRLLDTINPKLIKSMNASELKITFTNNSIIKLGSAENYEKSIVGSNASLIIFSEYGTYDNDNPYLFASPIMAPNNGRFVFISTPRGRNHYYDLWVKARQWPDWYCELKTVDDTKHITPEMMDIIRREHSEEFIQQEYYCSFDRGIEGSFYAKYVNVAIQEGRVDTIPYDPSLPVNTVWDLGYNNTVIIYFQIDRNKNVRLIDFDPQQNRSLQEWIRHVKSKPYVYGKHWAPHDVNKHEDTTGQTKFDFARQLGLQFEMREVSNNMTSAIPRVSVEAGIEQAMAAFNKISFDKTKCAYLIKALETYHRTWDDEKKRYSKEPYGDWSAHSADAFRYLALVLPLHETGMTTEEIHRGYNQTLFSQTNALDYPFNDDKNIWKRY